MKLKKAMEITEHMIQDWEEEGLVGKTLKEIEAIKILYKKIANIVVCKICRTEVKEAGYETGEEAYCECQNTLDAGFDKKLWEKEYKTE